ncbi:Gfo/Idh/MocA family protein [Myxacorys almedinensis]|nr:Gfo/Idh/MocA family oxidoreductase [Myxacorys almedinensis]
MSDIRVAIAGTGIGQKVHIPGFQSHPRTCVVAVYHRDLEKATAIAQAHNIPQAYSILEEMAARLDIDAVSISTPPFLHYEMAKIVLNANKHLLLEKPTALTYAEAKKIHTLALSKPVATAMNFEFRFVPAWQYLAELLAEGYVGQKRLIKIDWLVSSRADASRPWNWYARKDQGGGVLGAIGSHAFDYVAWLFGSVKRLSTHLSTSISARPDPVTGTLKPVDSDDTCTLMMELADGTPCQMCLSSVTVQGRGHWVEIYGDRGTLVLGSDNQKDYVHGFKLWGSQGGKELSELEVPKRLAFPQVFTDGRIAPFIQVVDRWISNIEAVRNGHARQESMPPSIREGMDSQLLMDLARESNETGTWVTVPL